MGLAVASNVAAIAQAIGLHLALRRKGLDTSLSKELPAALRILVAALFMGGIVWLGKGLIFDFAAGAGIWMRLLPIVLLVPIGVALYFGSLRLSGLRWRQLLGADDASS